MYERGGSTALSFQHPLGALEQTPMPAVAVCVCLCVCAGSRLAGRGAMPLCAQWLIARVQWEVSYTEVPSRT